MFQVHRNSEEALECTQRVEHRRETSVMLENKRFDFPIFWCSFLSRGLWGRMLFFFGSSYPGADLMQAGGDGFGWCVTAEHMTFQDPGVFVPSHICKVPGREDTTGSMRGD